MIFIYWYVAIGSLFAFFVSKVMTSEEPPDEIKNMMSHLKLYFEINPGAQLFVFFLVVVIWPLAILSCFMDGEEEDD